MEREPRSLSMLPSRTRREILSGDKRRSTKSLPITVSTRFGRAVVSEAVPLPTELETCLSLK
jgi:hypothetical protein